MAYPHQWSPISCRSSAGQGKFAGQRPTFYHCVVLCILGCLLFLICIEFVYLYFPVLFCLPVPVKWLAVKTTSEITYIVSSGALNSTQPKPKPFVWDYPGEPYQKGKTNLDFTEARDSEWQWRLLGHMQVCTSLQRDNHASTPPLSFLQAYRYSSSITASVTAKKLGDLKVFRCSLS